MGRSEAEACERPEMLPEKPSGPGQTVSGAVLLALPAWESIPETLLPLLPSSVWFSTSESTTRLKVMRFGFAPIERELAKWWEWGPQLSRARGVLVGIWPHDGAWAQVAAGSLLDGP